MCRKTSSGKKTSGKTWRLFVKVRGCPGKKEGPLIRWLGESYGKKRLRVNREESAESD